MRWHGEGVFSQVMVKKRRACFHRVGHIHTIATPSQNLPFKHGFNPHILGSIKWMTPFQHRRIEGIGNCFAWIIVFDFITAMFSNQRQGNIGARQPRLYATRCETHFRVKSRTHKLFAGEHGALKQFVIFLE